MIQQLHCQICGECAAKIPGANLIAFHTANDHAAEIDLKELTKESLKTPDGVDAVLFGTEQFAKFLDDTKQNDKYFLILRDWLDANPRIEWQLR